MEKNGLLVSIVQRVYYIDLGRKGLATVGAAEDGRASFTKGLLAARAVFREVHDNASNDLEALILVEHAYVTEERRYSGEPFVEASLSAALTSFDDALRVLVTVQDPVAYKNAETSWPHLRKYRYHTMPKDVFHIAANAHVTRLRNTLRSPGINNIEREVYEQRAKNMSAAQAAYFDLQKRAIGEESGA
jgi:hypothetical protein